MMNDRFIGVKISYQILCAFLLFFCAPDMFGVHGVYENKKVEEIMGLLSKRQLNPKQGGEFALGAICPGKSMIVEKDGNGRINHVGVKLFDRKIMKDYPSPSYLFVERYLLWILLTKDEARINERIKEDRVSIRSGQSLTHSIYNNVYLSLADIKPDQSFIITTDNSKYAVTWLEDRRAVLSVSFPIQYELIWGVNKKEAESSFKADLLDFVRNVSKYPSDNIPTELEETEKGCFCSDGDFYGLEEITSYRYYHKKEPQGYRLIYNPDYPVESTANLFTGSPDPAIQIQITQRMYGNKRESYTVPLAGFLAFCRANGCEVFVGIENQLEHQIDGSVIIVNRSLGYNHILYFSVDTRIWGEGARYPVVAQLYAFVPMHNVGGLYGKNNHK